MKSLFGMEQNGVFGSRIRKNWKPVATLHIGLRESNFGDILNGSLEYENQPVFVCSEKGEVIASFSPDVITGTEFLDEKLFKEIISELKPYTYRNTESGKTSLILTVKSDVSDWVVTSVIYPKEIYQSIKSSRTIFYLVIPFFTVFLFLLSYVFTRRFTKPLKNLSMKIADIGDDMNDLSGEDSRTEEIDLIVNSFNTMTTRIRKLMEDIKVHEKEKRKAYLQALELQLTPHFLYNALNTISWMADINGQENIREITRALTFFLKEVTTEDSGFISLEKEINLLSEYAVIQKYRYIDFNLIIKIPEELLHLYIHKMMLVNLMENNYHGFRQDSKNEIRVTAVKEGKKLVVKFRDNGAGFNPEEISTGILSNRRSIGLQNTEKRIHLYHGKGYGMKIDSSPGNGCSVTISLPVMDEPVE